MTAYDCYPFGSLMPGRYAAADTTILRITTTYTAHYDMGAPYRAGRGWGQNHGTATAADEEDRST